MPLSPTLFDPPDVDQREIIETALDTTLLVEAAAGTGKTTSMIRRMVGLLAEGRCTITTMAAVTFTRKATAELRARFQVALEAEARASDGRRRARLQEALEHIEHCFIGTIHSFCARLLRERPVEAGVDIGFEELDEDAEFRLRAAAWDEHVARMHADDDPLLATLEEVGLDLRDLREPYLEFADYPDVESWPVPEVTIDEADLDAARAALRSMRDHAEGMESALRAIDARDELMELYLELPRRVRHATLSDPRELLDVLEFCDDVPAKRAKVKSWPGGLAGGRAERDRWERFLSGHATPLVERRRRQRYGPAIGLLRQAVVHYDRMRAERGVLSYQDLLMKAAELLRDKPHVRRYFRRRFSHLLVDEFQDTDPVQAEVMLLLTADDPAQSDWSACRPVDGSLFVVGDPKQSIYRFRRADIVTYNGVRRIIETRGRVVELTANFRSVEPVIEWVNGVSGALFPAASDYAPADRPMDAARHDPAVADCVGVWRFVVPDALGSAGGIKEYEAETIARTIRAAIDDGMTVPRTQKAIDAGVSPRVGPGDFLVLTWTRPPLIAYAERLQAYGLPVDVTGGTAVNDVDEVSLLHAALAAAIEPDNPVPLVGVLRSALFGISDTSLYRFARAGGEFDFRSHERAREIDDGPIADALRRLSQHARWLSRMPAAAAIDRIASDLGLLARAVAGPGGVDRAGRLCKAIELLRSTAPEHWTAAATIEYLGRLVDRERYPPERHDGLPARPHADTAVRVMNLHQAKGLEAPIVFLAEGSWSGRPMPVRLHVDRRHGGARGFLRVIGPKRGWSPGRVLAEPEGWADHEREEALFLDAERDRLLYVAATRAGAQLVISRPGTKHLRWDKLVEHVAVENTSPEPSAVSAPARPRETLPDDAPAAFAASLQERWTALRSPTYRVEAVKEEAITGRLRVAGGEHGTEWGTVLHVLLEAAMTSPDGDLAPLASAAVQEKDLDPARASEAVEIVRAVTASDLWARARRSDRCLPEVPIQRLGEGEAPVIERGVIDLAFREAEGWVIVDYKTDDRGGASLEALVDHYAPQVRAYARAWTALTGEPVIETGLFFVHTRRHVVL